jgi:hypothetical protein
MNKNILRAALAAAGGLVYRLRGGPLKDWFPSIFGTQLSRLFWAGPTALLAWYVSGTPLWVLPALVATHFSALAFIGTGQYLVDFPLPRVPDLLGLARTTVAVLPLAYFATWVFVAYALSGLLHAHLYWLGHRTPYGSKAGEFLVGFVGWFVLALFL